MCFKMSFCRLVRYCLLSLIHCATRTVNYTCAFDAFSLLALISMSWYLSALSPSTFTRQVLGLRRAASVSALLSFSRASLTAMMAACIAASSTDICGHIHKHNIIFMIVALHTQSNGTPCIHVHVAHYKKLLKQQLGWR